VKKTGCVVLLCLFAGISVFAGGDLSERDRQEVLRGCSPRLVVSASDGECVDCVCVDQMAPRSGIQIPSSFDGIRKEESILLTSSASDADTSECDCGCRVSCARRSDDSMQGGLGGAYCLMPADWDELSYRLFVELQPSCVINAWQDWDKIREVGALRGVYQDPQKHPEGDAYVHTLLAVDAAAQLYCPDNDERRVMLLAALCHDLGKAETTQLIDGELMAPGHAARGVKLARALLRRFGVSKKLIEQVCELVRYHTAVHDMAPYGYRELVCSFETITLQMLINLVWCDLRAVSTTGLPCEERSFPSLDRFIEGACGAGVLG